MIRRMAEITCDRCGAKGSEVHHCGQDDWPRGWRQVEVDRNRFDICPDCDGSLAAWRKGRAVVGLESTAPS